VISLANILGVSYVGTETGSLSGSPWLYRKENTLKKTRLEVVRVINELTSFLEKTNVKVLIEGAYNHVAYTPKKLLDIYNNLDKKNVKIILDIFNYLNDRNYSRFISIFKECINLFKNDIVLIHVKDAKIENKKLVQCDLGKGFINWNKLYQLLKEANIKATFILEGTRSVVMKESIEYMKGIIK